MFQKKLKWRYSNILFKLYSCLNLELKNCNQGYSRSNWDFNFNFVSVNYWQLANLAFYLLELSLLEYEALMFKASLLCASAIYVARSTLQMTPWTPLLCQHAHYEVSQLRHALIFLSLFGFKVLYDIGFLVVVMVLW